MKLLVRMLVIPILFLSFGIMSSCDDDEDKSPVIVTYTAVLNGTSEVPPNASTATANATMKFNDDTNVFTLTINYNGLTVTDAHIHKGAVGVDGPIVIPLEVSASPIIYTPAALTNEQEADLKAGLYYVNLHSEAYPGGEIRGQLLPKGSGGY